MVDGAARDGDLERGNEYAANAFGVVRRNTQDPRHETGQARSEGESSEATTSPAASRYGLAGGFG